MELTIIGSGTGVPSIRRSSPSILIKVEGINLLFDTGPGSIRKLVETGLTYHEIDHIFYSHLHTDHVGDLPAFLFAARNPLSFRTKELSITGPFGLAALYDKFIEMYGKVIAPQDYEVKLREIKEAEIAFDSFKIKTKKLPHTENSIGYRIEDKRGKVIVYSGDTDFCEDIIELSRNADILVLECAFPDEMKADGHLTPSFAGKVARASKCKKLILTHIYPVCQPEELIYQCKKEFDGEIIVAEDLMKAQV